MNIPKITTENGTITSTLIEFQAHGILTASVTISLADSQQVFGGLALGKGSGMAAFIGEILRITGADSWESLEGVPVRLRTIRGSFRNTELVLGHFVDTRWLTLSELDRVARTKYS